MSERTELRREMVERQLLAQGIRDARVVLAMGEVPREEFVPRELVQHAYADAALPIGEGQTISQPYIVALATQGMELAADDRVLEVGTGSGYGAAILSRIAREVYTVESRRTLACAAEERFRRLGYDNIHVRHGDGTLGWAEHAPYDAITVTAGGPVIPEPLSAQLTVGGFLVIPVGATLDSQTLVRVHRVKHDRYYHESLGRVRFVPLVGAEGWEERLCIAEVQGTRLRQALPETSP
jgi:protein-L-isoaspartate(D-aspartate) O-methyltransferase